jgi:hypothetical protein
MRKCFVYCIKLYKRTIYVKSSAVFTKQGEEVSSVFNMSQQIVVKKKRAWSPFKMLTYVILGRKILFVFFWNYSCTVISGLLYFFIWFIGSGFLIHIRTVTWDFLASNFNFHQFSPLSDYWLSLISHCIAKSSISAAQRSLWLVVRNLTL